MRSLRLAYLYTSLGLLFAPAHAQDGEGRIQWSDIAALPFVPADARLAYGQDSQQFGELRLPKGAGPFPVVVLIHGGCWSAETDLRHLSPMAAALNRAGVATWTLEFRRIGQIGGGWPGTFEDIAHGVDRLREVAARYPIDLQRVLLLGHSSGGELALWAAARPAHPIDALLRPTLPVLGVIALAGITDLRATAAMPGACQSAVATFLGGTLEQVPDRYRATDPMSLLPLRIPTRLLHGELDAIVPVGQSHAFIAAARTAHDDARLLVLPEVGHFDFLAPSTAAFAATLRTVQTLLAPR